MLTLFQPFGDDSAAPAEDAGNPFGDDAAPAEDVGNPFGDDVAPAAEEPNPFSAATAEEGNVSLLIC